MKKRLSALFTAVVMLASFGAGLNATATLRGTSCENEAALLEALNIFPENAVTGLNTSEPVTRQEFAEYVEKAIGETDETVNGYSEKFTDFTAVGYVAKGVFDGFITGYPDGSFKPAQHVTAAEAEKMIIDASGYRYMAELKGDYPDAYTSLAAEIGLSKNVNKGAYSEIDTKDAVFLIYNMLNLEIPLISADGKGISFDSDKTILSEKFDIKKGQGIINANEYTSLSSSKGTAKDSVEIDETVYAAGISGAEKYLGYNVEYYYRDDKGEYTIVYADPSKKSNDMRIYAEEIERFDNSSYYYYDSEDSARLSKAPVSATADIIYNGKAMPEIDDNRIFTPEFGSVTLIDNNGDGKYEVISIIDRNIIVLNMYDDNEHVLYDKYSAANQVKADPEDSVQTIKVTTSQGAELSLNDLKEWDVLEIAQSADGEYTDIVVCRESFSGTINSIGTSPDNLQLLKFDEKEYKVSQKLTDYNLQRQTPFRVSQTYTFVLNSDGVIVGYKGDSAAAGGGSYGYLISVRKDDSEETFFYIKMFTADNILKTFRTVEKPKIDGQSSKNTEEAYGKMPLNPMLIYYKLDANGDVKEIDTIDKTDRETVNSLMLKSSVTNAKYSSSHRTIAGKMNFNDDSIVFILPENVQTAGEKDFQVKRAVDYFRHYASYTALGYSRDKISPYTEAAVVRDSTDATINVRDDIYLIQKVSNGINEDDEVVSVLELINGSGTKNLITESKEVAAEAKAFQKGITVGVKVGDAVMLSVNKDNEINCINVVYRPETGSFYPNINPSAGDDYLASLRIGLWDVYYRTDNYLRVIPADTDFNDMNIENLETNNIFVYEKDQKIPYRQGTVGEIKDYYSTNMASRILARTNDAVTQIIVIYK